VLEGGYDLEGLTSSVHGCAQVLAGATPPAAAAASVIGEKVLRRAQEQHRRHWRI